MSVEPSEYVKSLPIGERIPFPSEGIPFWEVFPYEGELQIKVLQKPTLPEPPRHGEAGPEECDGCNRPDADFLWTDEHWRLGGFPEPAALPAMVLLQPRGHYDLHDLPPQRAAELGAMLQRAEQAIMGLGGIARVHVNKWGDGGAHLHMFLIARPEGMVQMRGTCLPLWDDVLPKLPKRSGTRPTAGSLKPWRPVAAPRTFESSSFCSAVSHVGTRLTSVDAAQIWGRV